MSKNTATLWIVDIFLATFFVLAGFMKATRPMVKLAVTQMLANGVHHYRAGYKVVPNNMILLVLSKFVMFGRKNVPSTT